MRKKILITGATSGIGLSFFNKNIAKNLEFYLIGRNFSKLKKQIKNFKKSKFKLISFDFSKNLNKFNFKKIPKLDYVVLSAGIAKFNLIKEFDEKIFEEVLNINLIQTAKFIALLVKYDKINLIVSVHAWDGFVEYPIHSGPISKFTECDIEDLRAPLWRFGKEWKKETDIDDGQQ